MKSRGLGDVYKRQGTVREVRHSHRDIREWTEVVERSNEGLRAEILQKRCTTIGNPAVVRTSPGDDVPTGRSHIDIVRADPEITCMREWTRTRRAEQRHGTDVIGKPAVDAGMCGRGRPVGVPEQMHVRALGAGPVSYTHLTLPTTF